MSSEFGKRIRVSIFGESHGRAVGVVINGLPAGEAVDMEQLQGFMARRAPGQGTHTTARREGDTVEILSGITAGVTNGAPLAAMIANSDTKSGDYAGLMETPRPGHADYTAQLKYGGHNDIRGGGHFSGRLTAPLCVAGGIALQILARRGVEVGAHIQQIFTVRDAEIDPLRPDMEALRQAASRRLPVLSQAAMEEMLAQIAGAKAAGDSLGGIIECVADGLPAGLGSPMFDGVENQIAAVLFGIPALRGVEFGAGFSAAGMRGSAHNDAFLLEGERVRTATNNHGGILGGITSGMPLIVRGAVKPTPSIAQGQDTLSLATGAVERLEISGRHDPCIVPRAVPCVEAAVAVVLLDMMEMGV